VNSVGLIGCVAKIELRLCVCAILRNNKLLL